MKKYSPLLIGFAWIACSDSSSPSSPDASTDTDSGPVVLFEAGLGDASVGCSDASKLVYVLSEASDLYSFDPAALKFTKIGAVACPGGVGPNSMAVDRKGIAWVNGSTGDLFRVDTKDASCQATSFKPLPRWKRTGMGFSSNGPGSSAETLYISSIGIVDPAPDGGKAPTTRYLASIDLQSFATTVVGPYKAPLTELDAELTGTGDGDLYGFFRSTPASLAKINKGDATTTTPIPLTGVDITSDFAFSFWGGDFWFYTYNPPEKGQPQAGSRVTRLKASTDNSIVVAVADVGFSIIGAGVSTCAPTRPPI